MILDDFSAHWTAEVRACAESLGVILEKVPPEITWRCQPADVAWNKPLKDRLRSAWTRYLSDQLTIHREEQPAERPFKMFASNRRQISLWILNAWSNLFGSIIHSGFNRIVHADSDVNLQVCDADQELGVTAASVVDALEALGLVDRSIGEISARTAIENRDYKE